MPWCAPIRPCRGFAVMRSSGPGSTGSSRTWHSIISDQATHAAGVRSASMMSRNRVRPAIGDIHARQVREHLDEALRGLPASAAIGRDSPPHRGTVHARSGDDPRMLGGNGEDAFVPGAEETATEVAVSAGGCRMTIHTTIQIQLYDYLQGGLSGERAGSGRCPSPYVSGVHAGSWKRYAH